MSIDNLEEILLSVDNCDSAMAALPDSVRAEILSVKGEVDRRVKEREEADCKREMERREDEEKAEKAWQAELAKYSCKGTWGERVPLIRRFVLCESIGKEFVGHQISNPTHWVDRVETCPIDLVRGFMGPYWGYYGMLNPLGNAFKRIKDVIDAEGTSQLPMTIRYNFGSFSIDDKINNRPFVILSYTVDADGNVKVTGRSEPMTWDQHRAALKAEFAHEGDADPE